MLILHPVTPWPLGLADVDRFLPTHNPAGTFLVEHRVDALADEGVVCGRGSLLLYGAVPRRLLPPPGRLTALLRGLLLPAVHPPPVPLRRGVVGPVQVAAAVSATEGKGGRNGTKS